MILNHLIFLILLNMYASNAAVFLWSNKKLEISPLQPFNMEQFSILIKELGNPEIYIFKTPLKVSPDIKEITDGYYSAYVPNGNINVENATDLVGDGESDVFNIKEIQKESNGSANILSVIVIIRKQYKREIDGDEVTPFSVDEIKATSQSTVSKEPVMYKSQNKKDDLYALLYSSKPLLLKINDTERIERYLGNTFDDMIIYDTRLNVNIPVEGGGKVTLRFSFSWLNGYWSLPSVKITDTQTNGDYNLTTDENIMAPAHFSYHCNGHTVFSDPNGAVELHIYDLQVQTDSKNGKFGDANDCVSFTTAPIWSGLFVTTLLGIGLIVALTAIMDIKTMDKFDNYKTKNLTITISE